MENLLNSPIAIIIALIVLALVIGLIIKRSKDKKKRRDPVAEVPIAPLQPVKKPAAKISASRFSAGEYYSPPMGYHAFKKANPGSLLVNQVSWVAMNITMADLISLHTKTMDLHTWTTDQETFGVKEHWASHYDEFIANKPFRDDCDGTMLTELEVLAIARFALPEELTMHVVDIHGGIDPNHAIATIDYRDNTWMLDCRERQVLAIATSKYNFIAHRRLSEAQWRTTVRT